MMVIHKYWLTTNLILISQIQILAKNVGWPDSQSGIAEGFAAACV